MRRHRFKAIAVVVMLATAATAGAETILSGLSVIDVRSGDILENRTLVIDDGIIRSIESGSDLADSGGPDARHYDFSGHYAIPGLWDMHVHLRGGPKMAEDNRLWLRQYLGYGVTTVRDAGGDIPEFVLEWRDAIAAGAMSGPTIYTSLRKIDGSPVFRPGSVEIRDVSEIDQALRSLESVGADFIKVNDGEFSNEVFLEIIRQADILGLDTAAHIPIDLSIESLADAGLDSIEHDFFLLMFGSAREREVIDKYRNAEVEGDPFMHYFGMFNDFATEIDEDKARRNLRVMARRKIAITPTLYLGKRWHDIDPAVDPKQEPGYAETPESILRSHDPQGYIAYMGERSGERVAADLNMIAEARRLVGMAAEEGVDILAGSDTGKNNTFMYPGDSLHHELAALVDAGLSPRQAIAAATVNAAAWLGVADQAGAIEEGMRADIVLLEGNPLEDIRNTRSIVAVIRAGRLYDTPALDELRRLPREALP